MNLRLIRFSPQSRLEMAGFAYGHRFREQARNGPLELQLHLLHLRVDNKLRLGGLNDLSD